jgi:polyribonucleotide nucleotidyltransferase
LHISNMPWAGPVAGVRVGRVDGKLIANPTYEEIAKSDMDIVVAASKDAITMVEGECKEISEQDFADAVFFAHQAAQSAIELQVKMREAVGKTKWSFTPPTMADGIAGAVREVALSKIKAACAIQEKHSRYGSFKTAKKETVAALAERFTGLEGQIKEAYEELRYNTMREQVVLEKRRVDGRDLTTVRPITIEVGLLPRVHGSSLFTRGETQAICTATLGTSRDEQHIDGLIEDEWKGFLLHYNFPPFSVPVVVKSVTATSQSARSRACCRRRKSSRTRCASCPRSPRATARRRWPRCVAARSR